LLPAVCNLPSFRILGSTGLADKKFFENGKILRVWENLLKKNVAIAENTI